MRRYALALAVAAFLLLLFAAPQVRAQATPLSFKLCEAAIVDITTGTTRVDDDGVLHVRDQLWTSTFEGTFAGGTAFAGAGSGTFSYNLDLASGNGDLFGAFRWTFHDFRGAGDVTFSGRFSGAFAAGVISNDLIGHAGVMMLAAHAPSDSVVCPSGAEPWAGTILMPQG